ncbi:protein kinase domain-containing protein [Nocardia sp. NPDC004123]
MAGSDPFETQSDRPPDITDELEGADLSNPQVVGRGGFGVVYRCWQQALGRNVAVKVLTARADLEPESFERFFREQRAMGALSGHPNIVHVLEVGTTRSGRPYLVMPYFSRGSLEARIRREGRIPLDDAIRITIKLAGAVETAHRAGILHRDIKPGNVLLTDYGEPQLADFGIARINGGFETTAGVVVGSPAFTAPEVLRSGSPSVSSDVYGLGATLFCMITGHAAFERRSGEQVVAQFLRIAAEPLPDLRPDGIPDDVCSTIESSMSHDPGDRPNSAADFGELLRRIQFANDMSVDGMAVPSPTHDPADTYADASPHRSTPSSRRSRTPPTPATKFRPSTSERPLVPRDRLMAMLGAGSRPRLTVIHGPAGFGKSTLAVQWARFLEEQQVAVAWLNADRDDNNVVWLLTDLIEAIRRVRPALAGELARTLEESGEGAARFVLTTLINEIHEHRERLALVIDDWHQVTDPAAIAAMRFLLEKGCHHLQIIVTSRSTEGLPLATMRVRNELIEVDLAALRFDASEASCFLVELGGLSLTDGDITELSNATDGWAAALQLAVLSLRGHRDPAALISHISGRHHMIAEYLAENVLDTVNSDVLNVLLETSLPERVCGDLANALTGRQDGQAMLEDIERQNLFLRRVDENGEWFRYHPLFAQFLRERIERDHPTQLDELHRAAASWFADRGLLSEAIDHALASGDDERAVDIVENRAMDHIQNARIATLLGLVAKLPPERIANRTRLQIALGWAHVLMRQTAELQTALRLANASLESSMTEADRSALAAEVALIEGTGRAMSDHVDDLDNVVTDCMSRTDVLTPWTLSIASNIAEFLAIYRFDFDEAREWHLRAAPYHRQVRGTFGLTSSHCMVGIAAHEQLDIIEAERNFRMALDIATTASGKLSYPTRLASAMLGDLLYERDQLSEAERLLNEVHELDADGGPVEFMMATYATGARIMALRGDLDGAAKRLEGAHAARILALPRLAARITNEQVRLGLPITTRGHTETTIRGTDGIATLTAELNEATAIRLLLREGTPAQIASACDRATKLCKSIAPTRRPRAGLEAQLLVASCQAASGQIEGERTHSYPRWQPTSTSAFSVLYGTQTNGPNH